MTTIQLTVPNISCGHCVATIERVVGELPGVAAVTGDIPTQKVDIQFDAPATLDQIVATLKEWEYPPAP